MNSALDCESDKSFYKMYVHRERRRDVFLFISSISSGVLVPFQTHLELSRCGKVSYPFSLPQIAPLPGA